jgi:electron transport complex protein RnfG
MPEWFSEGGKGNVIGKNPANDNLTVSKDGGEVDAITAATISSRCFLKALNSAYGLIAIQEAGI